MRYRVITANAADNEAAERPTAGIAPAARIADRGRDLHVGSRPVASAWANLDPDLQQTC